MAFGDGPSGALRDYVERFRGAAPGALFLTIPRRTQPRRPMNPYLLGTLFQRLGVRAGVHANPHRFRHTFATWAIENHARELDVQYPARPFHLGDGAALLGDLRRGQGGRRARRVQPRRPLARNRGQRGRLSLLPKQRAHGA